MHRRKNSVQLGSWKTFHPVKTGRNFSQEELVQIRKLITEDPAPSRAELSRLTCQALKWYKADGGLKDMSARVVMLRMQEDGLISLPPARCKRPDPTVYLTGQTNLGLAIAQPAGTLTPLYLQRIQYKSDSHLWNEYIERYHYLGHKPLPGAQLRYFIYAQNQLIALLGFGAAAWQTAPRDQFIGWSYDQRKKNLHLIINNPRKISWTWNLWKIWAKKTNNHSPIIAIVLIKSDSAGFFVQISSQNHEAISPHQMGEKYKIDYI